MPKRLFPIVIPPVHTFIHAARDLLSDAPSAVNIDGRTRKKGGFVASQPSCRIPNVGGNCESTQWYCTHHSSPTLRGIFATEKKWHPTYNFRCTSGRNTVRINSHVCLASHRMNNVESNLVFCPFKRQAFAGIGDTCFRRSVPDESWPWSR